MENGQIKNIINKIKAENIVPESKLKLSFKSYLFWAIWLGMLVLSALFFSLIILSFLDIRLEFFHYLKLGRFFRIIFMSLPLFWLGFSILALTSGVLALRKTKRGYRYSSIFVTSLGLLIITIIGSFFHFFQTNRQFEKNLIGMMPNQRGMMFPAGERWNHPEDGLLGGEIGTVFEDYFWLKTFHDEQWKIVYTKDTKLETGGLITTGNQVGVIGEKIDEGIFKAKFIGGLPRKMHLERMINKKESPGQTLPKMFFDRNAN